MRRSWLFDSEALLRELARCRKLVINVPIPDLEATHFGLNRAVNALWDLEQTLLDGKPGQAEGENVGQDVPRVGKERQGVRGQPPGEFDRQHDACEGKRPLQGRSVIGHSLHEFILPSVP